MDACMRRGYLVVRFLDVVHVCRRSTGIYLSQKSAPVCRASGVSICTCTLEVLSVCVSVELNSLWDFLLECKLLRYIYVVPPADPDGQDPKVKVSLKVSKIPHAYIVTYVSTYALSCTYTYIH